MRADSGHIRTRFLSAGSFQHRKSLLYFYPDEWSLVTGES